MPSFTIEKVGNSASAPLTISLFEGSIGQEIFFVYSEAQTGAVAIVGGGSNPLVLPGAGATPTVTLNAKGETAHFLCIDDGTGNGDWFIVGGDGYAIT